MKKISSTILLLVVFQISLVSQTNVSDPGAFPKDEYTPYGYLDNPYHSFVLNRSGIIRSVPPLGFGFWCRQLPWPYGMGMTRNVNYLSFLELSILQDGIKFNTSDDFKKNGIQLVSNYHTKNIFSYNWQYKSLVYDIKYLHPVEDGILCIVSVKNTSNAGIKVTLHATNTYGYPESGWWGSDGVTSGYNSNADAGVSKIWAYGDVFGIGSNTKSASYKATSSEEEWKSWINKEDFTSNTGAHTSFPQPVYTVQSYKIDVPPLGSSAITLALTRGKNEISAIDRHKEILGNAPALLTQKEQEDNQFYQVVPLLSGDWPNEWKHGWIYDWETLRMNIREPLGNFKHHWDGMQIFSPRSVLGETAIDAMCMSFANVNLAKDMLLGTFADAVMPNIPCSREDGSMNMIGADGRECGTAPIWGMPFQVINSIYERDKDDKWVNDLYPYLKKYLEWWLQNRTDKEGWFHAANSWESGQDGSKRFLVADHDPGAAADFVRTVDIEAAMAHAMLTMQNFAKITNRQDDINYWEKQAEKRIQSTRSMFVNGWFRDVDARTNQPIILKDYYDIMMFLPASLNIASAQQMKELAPMFYHFRKNPTHFLEWPSFLFPFTEAAWNAGLQMFNAEEVAKIGNRIYPRLDERNLQPVLMEGLEKVLPPQYSYRIPGVSDEFWPISETNPGGCENYGWGSTFPTLVIRNIIGFREFNDGEKSGFYLSPSLPDNLVKPGKSLGITDLNYRKNRINVKYTLGSNNKLETHLVCDLSNAAGIKVLNSKNQVIKSSAEKSLHKDLSFSIKNGEMYKVIVEL